MDSALSMQKDFMDLKDAITCESILTLASPLCEQGQPFFYMLTGATTNSGIQHAFAFENLNQWFRTLETSTNPMNRQPLEGASHQNVSGKRWKQNHNLRLLHHNLFFLSKQKQVGVALCVNSPYENMYIFYLEIILQYGEANLEPNGEAAEALHCMKGLLEQKWREEPTCCQADIAGFIWQMINLGNQHTFACVNDDPTLCDKLGIPSLLKARLPPGNTPLMMAVDCGDVNFIRLLLS